MTRQSSRRGSKDLGKGERSTSGLSRKRECEELVDRDAGRKRSRTDDRPAASTRIERREVAKGKLNPALLDPDNADDLDKFLGFSAFRSTKGIKVPGNNVGVADIKVKRREYTQMLHRKKLYEVPLTKQQLVEKEATAQATMQE